MGTTLNSYDHLIAAAANHGTWLRAFALNMAATTAASGTGSGLTVASRFLRPIAVPSLGSGLTGMHLTYIRMLNSITDVSLVCGIEYNLGTINMATNAFTDGVAMPTKEVRGASVQTAASLIFLAVDAAVTATTPTVTITYTDQDGNTGNSAPLTLPTSPVAGSAFLVAPHLASGDTGIRDVTNITRSAGSAGTMSVFGVLPLVYHMQGGSLRGQYFDVLAQSNIPYKLAAGDLINFYRTGSTSATDLHVFLCGVADD